MITTYLPDLKSKLRATGAVLALTLCSSTIFPTPVGASDLLLENPGRSRACDSGVETSAPAAEAAAGFKLNASIDRIVARGSFPANEGVWVRFFEDSGDGPGALLSSYFLLPDDSSPQPLVGATDRLDLTLPEPFRATGRHYVSIEPQTSTAPLWWSSEAVTPISMANRARIDGEGWVTLEAGLCFSLYGALESSAVIDSLGETSLSRSGFLEVFGSNFGTEGELLVDGQAAVLATWTSDRIAAYVPEAAGPGTVNVEVVSGGATSNGVLLEVSVREPQGRFLWRVRLDSFYSQVRPVVGPDGTVYAVDVHDRLYAVSPDGAVLWVALDAGSKGVDVAADGTIYTGNEDWIKAFNTDGSVKWTFTQNPRAFILIDVAVGPDGNVYGVGSSGMGVFSLTSQGKLRWTNPEVYDRPIVTYTEIVFGPGPDGQDQLYFSANRHTRAVRLADGASIFTNSASGRPVVSPVDGTFHTADRAYAPDGSQVWQFYEFLNGLQTVSGTGIHYNTTSMVTPRIFAIETDGTQRWGNDLAESAGTVDVDPTETVLVLGTSGVLSSPAAVIGVDTADGATLWRAELPAEETDVPNPWTGGNGFNQFIDSKADFQADGSAAYLQTAIAPGGVVTDRAFLYAVDLDPGMPPSSELLRSTDIQLKGLSRGGGVVIRSQIKVRDESLEPVSKATVHVTWTLPDGSSLSKIARTNGSGLARLRVAGEGGFYTITVTDITKNGYVFDPLNSVLSKTIAWF